MVFTITNKLQKPEAITRNYKQRKWQRNMF